MATTRSTRAVKKLEKPKPLKILPTSRHSMSDVPGQVSLNSTQEIVALLDTITTALSRKTLNDEISYYTTTLITKMKSFGQRLEDSYKDQLDKAFAHFRNASKDDNIDFAIRMNLLQLIELRAMHWTICASVNAYYLTKCCIPEVGECLEVAPVVNSNVLGPGEILKSSGKYAAPTKVPGKNYFKDEVVIRNSDSGKVMGIKGRRVHMIEELSETVISFQRVSPGAKERNVQITGPEEEKIVLAKQLIEDTIKRNASPIREVEKDIGSNSSLNSSASEDSTNLPVTANNAGKMLNLNKEESYEYKHSVIAGGKTIRLSSNDHDWVKWAKLILESAAKFKENDISPNQTTQTKQTQTSLDQSHVVTPHYVTEQFTRTVPPINDHDSNDHKYEAGNKVDINGSVKKSVLQKKNSVVKLVQYTREFLLDLSSCKAASQPPPGWDKICQTYDIGKQVTSYFDAVLYSKKWLENEGKTVPLVDVNLAFDSE